MLALQVVRGSRVLELVVQFVHFLLEAIELATPRSLLLILLGFLNHLSGTSTEVNLAFSPPRVLKLILLLKCSITIRNFESFRSDPTRVKFQLCVSLGTIIYHIILVLVLNIILAI
jgi:hypothetical protein